MSWIFTALPAPLARSLALAGLFALGPLAGAGAAQAAPSGIPIVLREDLGLARPNELVTALVPYRKEMNVLSQTDLRIADAVGHEIPAQWRVIARWHGRPDDPTKAIRFVHARFQVSLAANETRICYAEIRKPEHGPQVLVPDPILIDDHGTYATIDTGYARFSINRNFPNFLQTVAVDLNGDGIKSADEQIVGSNASAGAVLVDRFGGAYVSLADPNAKIVWEDIGPLSVTVRIDGAHVPATVPNIGRDFLRYSTRYTFTRGSAAVKVAHVLRNDYLLAPLGHIGFARYLVHLRLNTTPFPLVEFGGDADQPSIKPGYGGGTEAFLMQDSSGGANWNQPGTTFSGWRVYRGPFTGLAPEGFPAGAPAAAGSRAEGWMDVRDGKAGMLVALRYPWQNYPYALRALADGSVLLDFWPAEHAGLHWIDDAQRKSHEFTLEFHKTTGFDARAAALRGTQPLLPIVDPAAMRASLTWGDHGDLRDPQLDYASMLTMGAAYLAQRYDFMNHEGGFGWNNFGEPVWAKNTHAAASPRNRLTYFDRFVLSGARPWFVANEAFALHSMDMRTYHIAGFKAEEHPNVYLNEGIPAWNSPNKLGRDKLDPKLDPHRAGIPAAGHGWNGFDAEHMVVDDVYEYYLLTGSHHALDALRKIGEAMLTWPQYVKGKEIYSSRSIGWTLRALMKVYVVTGDPRLAQRAKDIVGNVEQFRGKKASPVTGLVYHYLARQIYGGGTHNMDTPFDLPWQISVGMYGLALYARETLDPAAVTIIADVTQYLLDYGLQDSGVFKEAIDVENHLDFNPKPSNDGVNTWIASALAIAYRVTGDPKALERAAAIFDQNKTHFGNAGDYYHWYHTVGIELGK